MWSYYTYSCHTYLLHTKQNICSFYTLSLCLVSKLLFFWVLLCQQNLVSITIKCRCKLHLIYKLTIHCMRWKFTQSYQGVTNVNIKEKQYLWRYKILDSVLWIFIFAIIHRFTGNIFLLKINYVLNVLISKLIKESCKLIWRTVHGANCGRASNIMEK